MAIGGRTCYKIMDIVLDIIANEIINWTDVIIGFTAVVANTS